MQQWISRFEIALLVLFLCRALAEAGEPGLAGRKDVVLSCDFEDAAFERTDLRFRDVAKLKIESVWVNVYHGGTKAAPEDLHLYLDNMQIGAMGTENVPGETPRLSLGMVSST